VLHPGTKKRITGTKRSFEILLNRRNMFIHIGTIIIHGEQQTMHQEQIIIY
jgi:hypothetical protein